MQIGNKLDKLLCYFSRGFRDRRFPLRFNANICRLSRALLALIEYYVLCCYKYSLSALICSAIQVQFVNNNICLVI